MRVFFLVFLVFATSVIFAQEFEDTNAIDVSFLKGNVLAHSPDMYQLVTGHPDGVLVSFSKHTHGKEQWQSIYNYPDYGGYFLFQDFKNEILGKNYAIGAFYNFYFLNRNLSLKIAQGIAMTTNPYHKVTNSKNKAFGSKLMGNIDFVLNYKKENIIDKMGIQAGLVFTHFSNGRIKSPNSGINTYGFNLGINYNFDAVPNKKSDTVSLGLKYTEPIRYNVVLRTGVNESPVIESGQKPFYHLSFYADKRINRKSALQAGTELFLTTSFKEYIRFRAISFPEDHVDINTDYKRVGLFIGHELFINRISLEAQLGYYVYRPFKEDAPIYDRVGMKYYISNQIFTGLSLKTHGFLAESMELVMGIRF
ncbi:acyloxyacyl hydrolase [Flavobacterium psychrotolerans]|uniref:Deacylase n=1 Tax=Flavobacterium psychrotolerans TaxID=2169410 RepID=A0A2U1JN51_9FLAO|nr:acyloxyacyl hydrolase [Flavobacterium psychrotolerans]PWA06435.1 deacylase [Flavobacterium psychrotolerans]